MPSSTSIQNGLILSLNAADIPESSDATRVSSWVDEVASDEFRNTTVNAQPTAVLSDPISTRPYVHFLNATLASRSALNAQVHTNGGFTVSALVRFFGEAMSDRIINFLSSTGYGFSMRRQGTSPIMEIWTSSPGGGWVQHNFPPCYTGSDGVIIRNEWALWTMRYTAGPQRKVELFKNGLLSAQNTNLSAILPVAARAAVPSTAAVPAATTTYPQTNLTSNQCSAIGYAGFYNSSSSSTSLVPSQAPWTAFGSSVTTTGFSSASNMYNVATGVYIGASSTTATTNGSSSAAYRGEWLQIQMPQAIAATGYSLFISGNTASPKSWVLLGSSNGSTWTVLDTQNGYTTSPAIMTSVSRFTWGTTKQAYSYFRLVCTQTNTVVPASTSFSVRCMKLTVSTPAIPGKVAIPAVPATLAEPAVPDLADMLLDQVVVGHTSSQCDISAVLAYDRALTDLEMVTLASDISASTLTDIPLPVDNTVVTALPSLRPTVMNSIVNPGTFSDIVCRDLLLIQDKFDAVSANVNLMIERINHTANVCNITRNAVVNTSTIGDMYAQLTNDMSTEAPIPYIT